MCVHLQVRCNHVLRWGLQTILFQSRHPDDLYKNGIQRTSFIPAIDLLKAQFDVTGLDSGTGLSFELSPPPISRLNALMFQTIAAYPELSHMPTIHH